ncbi:GlxA family transcriptional regulator [Paraburkholderia caribensis]|uniref:GlxA family transcriptional regulator n=1 Tax=Paraburkholderia caribensis TaxID=75105 RepID=UPI0020904DCB|nr:helix-turn-helix domain-containing protein [Paraburkholderia caribensis]MCO4883388.1 helix-turn-helix domain-containing protein [Paraburkholderia caribensis]
MDVCTMSHCVAAKSVISPHRSKSKRIDIALFNGFALPDTAAIIEVFQKANALLQRNARRAYYQVSLLSASGGRIASSSSVFVWTESIDSHCHINGLHTLFIAGGTGAQLASRDERLIVWLGRAYRYSDTVHPIAEGHLLLDATGAEKSHDPQHDSVTNQSSARATLFGEGVSPVHAALHIVREDLGGEFAQQIARSMAPQDDTSFGTLSKANSASQVSDKIIASARWLEANVDRPISIDHAAQIAAMSERNFLRRFKNEMGMTPSDYLLQARLDMSCRMLVETRLPIDKIARRCGIGSGGHLAKLFRKHLSTTPTEYRMRHEAQRAIV